MTTPGGLSNIKLEDDSVKELIKNIRNQLENKTTIKYDTVTVHSYKTQVVAGIIYYVKINIEGNNYVHLKIMQHLPHTDTAPELLNHLMNKTIDDEINFF